MRQPNRTPSMRHIARVRASRKRKSFAQRLVSVIYWSGVMIVATFVLWALAMVIWQAVDQWHR